jgi:ComF family protein
MINLSRTAELRLWQLLVPGVCGLCEGEAQWARCRGGLDLCAHCEAALPGHDAPLQLGGASLVVAPFHYRPPADFMVRQLKFAGDRSFARTLGLFMAETRQRIAAPLPALLVPVPLHASRLRERGFNQARELALRAGRQAGVPVARDLLRRMRATRAQSGLPAGSRADNVRGCFEVRGKLERGVRIAVVDDVLTTGSTAMEAAQCLRAAGAGEVEIWVACRVERRAAGPAVTGS